MKSLANVSVPYWGSNYLMSNGRIVDVTDSRVSVPYWGSNYLIKTKFHTKQSQGVSVPYWGSNYLINL